MILKFRVSEQTISAVNTRSVPRIGSKDYLILQFSFSNDWEGLTKIAYLQMDSVSEPIEIKDGLVEVPEWFTEQESFNVTLLGTDGTKEVPTNIVSVKLEKSNDLWVKDAPEPQQSWLIVALESAKKAEDALTKAPKIGDDGNWYIWDATKGTYVDTGRYSVGSAPYIGANGNWFVGDDDSGVSATGPRGPAGKDGEPGAPGKDGRDGVDGRNGVSVTHEWVGTTLKITSASGTTSADLKGDPGHNGSDGYTPVRGTDYWTAEDVAEIQSYVNQQLGVIENGSY